MKKIYIILICALLASCLGASRLSAKEKETNYVKPGFGGIAVLLGYKIANPDNSDNPLLGYNVYRRIKGESKWSKINNNPITIVSNKDEFIKITGSEYLPQLMQYYKKETESEMWNFIQSSLNVERIAVSLFNSKSLLALGLAYIDKDAKPNNIYEYSYSEITKDKESELIFRGSSSLGDFIAPIKPFNLKIKVYNDPKPALLSWETTKPSTNYGYEIWRKNILEPEYSNVYTLITSSDSTNISIIDTTAKYEEVYNYYIVPFDYLFNKGASSDTIMFSVKDFDQIPISQNIKSSSSENGIKIEWTIGDLNPFFIGTVVTRAYNSPDSLFVPIDTIPYKITSYIDKKSLDGKKYYYKVQTLAFNKMLGAPSAFTGDVFQATRPPLPPSDIQCTAKENGTRIDWKNTNTYPIKGFMVFRGFSNDDTLKQISAIINAETYFDADTTLSPFHTYIYAVKAITESFVESDFSNKIYIQPKLKHTIEIPSPPVVLQDAGAIRIYWNVDFKSINNISGINIYKKVANSDSVYKLNESPLTNKDIDFLDKEIFPGKAVEYYLSLLDITNNESEKSKPNSIVFNNPGLTKPINVRAVWFRNSIVINWAQISDNRIEGFEIWRREKGKAPIKISTLQYGLYEFKDENIIANTTYYYTIVSINKDSKSLPSLEVVAVP